MDNGQVKLVPRAESKSARGGRLQTTVPVVPDAPIGHFRLRVFGGERGYLANTRSLCFKTPVIRVGFIGQNGKTHKVNAPVKVRCEAGKKRGGRAGRR